MNSNRFEFFSEWTWERCVIAPTVAVEAYDDSDCVQLSFAWLGLVSGVIIWLN